ncbi:phenylalanine--tRNA ligase subunit beta [Streptomyces caniscabiei]|uniref:phenylalanine--tRNA ligase subunit beta n=1 Tax=Streptomyces caniscabiei TaxID=2746961 RepID=UPI0029B2E2CB|nr:phenylalanine--tRNA ligase subunit beta [Streptomyces caniscabiei]MDX2775833.1 phenylalanine--tRNA ligase subunit beta [Streptomyces caniscabiei]
MIVSVNWLKKFTDVDLPIDELATLIGARLVEIEEVIDLGAKYKDVVIAKVVSCEKLEGSDHLNVTKLDDGGVTQGVERDGDGLVQVVCGAPNIREGLMVAWLPPKSVVPETYGNAEPFTLDARKLRGMMSNGMIASPRELDLSDDHDGILELGGDVTPGASFAKTYELDDYLLDIENKSLTHRPDCFGIVGFAREVAAIQDKPFHTPEWLAELAPDFGGKAGDIAVPRIVIENPELSSRYQAVILGGADEGAQSPLLVQTYLSRVGVRPISAVVDVTNYLMMLTGQPLHAFDYDKVVAVAGSQPDIHVRAGRAKEQLALLDGRTIELTPDDIVIAAGDKAVGLAGAMGGAATEIDASTKTIILESATFNLYNLRATQMRHGIFSEAITRFTKGQPVELTAPVLAEAVRLMGRHAGAKRVSDVAESYPVRPEHREVTLPLRKVNDVLGVNQQPERIVQMLKNVEFDASIQEGMLRTAPPYWRADIHIAEDVIEEIGRLNGFDSILPVLPKRDFTAVSPSSFDKLRADIRQILIRAGANEVLTYNFVHGDVLRRADQDPAQSYRIVNSISPELQYYRQSITPSLLGLVHGNIKAGFDEFALFELNKTHLKSAELVEGVPAEMHRIGLVVARKKPAAGAPYYQAKHLLEYLGNSLGLQLEYRPLADTSLTFMRPFETRRSARVVDVQSNQSIGIVGEYKKGVARNFKLPDYAAGFELLTEGIALALEHKKPQYTPISRYPSTDRDLCFKVNADIVYQQVIDSVKSALIATPLETNVSPVDIYQPEGMDTRNITVRIKFTAHDHTLTSDEVTSVVDAVAAAVLRDVDGQVV